MRKFLLIFLLSTGASCFAHLKPTKTIITVAVSQHMNNLPDFQIGVQRPLDLEIPMKFSSLAMKNGMVHATIYITQATNISLILNRSVLGFPFTELLVRPGDSLHIDLPDVAKTGLLDLQFSGRGANTFQMLQKLWNPVFGFVNKQKWRIQTTFSEYLKSQGEAALILDSGLRDMHLKLESKTFDIIKAQTISVKYVSLFELMADSMSLDTVRKFYINNILQRKIRNDLVKKAVFFRLPYLHKELLYLALLDYGARNRVNVGTIPRSNFTLFISIISRFYEDVPELKNHLIAEQLIVCMKSKGISAEVKNTVNDFLNNVQKGKLYDQVLSCYKKLERNNSKGEVFFDFALEDTAGKIVKLSNYAGKIVFLDFYFTGCGPCRKLVPTIDSLERKYAKRNIVFISISIDKSINLWKNGRGIFSSPRAIQLYTNGLGKDHPLINHHQIISYPTIFLIDPKGRILHSNLSYELEKLTKSIEEALL